LQSAIGSRVAVRELLADQVIGQVDDRRGKLRMGQGVKERREFGVRSSEFKIQSSEFRVRVQSSGFRV
jgi:hypothetical protein